MNRNNNPQPAMSPWLGEALKQIRNERETTYPNEDDICLKPAAGTLCPEVLEADPYLYLSPEERYFLSMREQTKRQKINEAEEASPTSSAEEQVPLPQPEPKNVVSQKTAPKPTSPQWDQQHPEFIKALEIVLKKAEKLESRHNFEKHNNPARHLYNAIMFFTKEYKNGNKTLEVFKTDCQKEIERYRPQLETHRGWKQILGNLLVAVLTLVVFYPAALAIHKRATGNTLFFSGKGSTDSSKKAEQLAGAIEALEEESSNETTSINSQPSGIS